MSAKSHQTSLFETPFPPSLMFMLAVSSPELVLVQYQQRDASKLGWYEQGTLLLTWVRDECCASEAFDFVGPAMWCYM